MTNKKETPTAAAGNIDPLGISKRFKCGLIMPISKSQGLEPEHWLNVKGIICEALVDTPLDVRLVSESDDVGVIHKSIVQNIYQNDIVICDVSTHNANVMFELGLRLAFDKPTVIIKDDETPFSFDTQVIEHIVYKRSLHYVDIVSFKKKLKEKVLATIEQSRAPDFSTFLRHFTINHISKIEERNVSINEALMVQLEQIQRSINSLEQQKTPQPAKGLVFKLKEQNENERKSKLKNDVESYLTALANNKGMDMSQLRKHLDSMDRDEFEDVVSEYYSYYNSLNLKVAPFPPDAVSNEIMRFILGDFI
ncbi:hypothetical protein [Aeromonas dhakensis]|uniref:hypothetical protein n=1 Tax=Aeromonas dhakensis TaxID=196024 RepID=UPI00244CD2B7|nr:hypothetical protein [Aeromonas dhakensis]MDH0348701.1 hypothetical protein [Aeromonas dhakensis]